MKGQKSLDGAPAAWHLTAMGKKPSPQEAAHAKRAVAHLLTLSKVEQQASDAMASAIKVLTKLGIERASDNAISTIAAAIMQRENVDRLMTWQPKQ